MKGERLKEISSSDDVRSNQFLATMRREVFRLWKLNDAGGYGGIITIVPYISRNVCSFHISFSG